MSSRRRGGANVPGSGATSFGAALRGASKSTCTGSSSEGAMMCVNAIVGVNVSATLLRAGGKS
jgi:hypothetical protein